MRTLTLVLAALLAVTVLAPAGEGGTRPDVAAADRIPEIKERAIEGDTLERAAALAELGAITDEKRLTQFQVPQFLLKVLNDDTTNSIVRSAAAEALAKIVRYVPDSADTILRPMLTRLQDNRNESTAVRCKIAQAMAGFLDVEAVSHRTTFQGLVRIAKERTDPPLLVAEVLRTLGRTGCREGLTAVLLALKPEEDEQVRSAALEALEALLATAGPTGRGTEEMIAQLVTIISDDKVPVEIRIRAMKALVSSLRAGVNIAQVSRPLVEVLGKACEKNKEQPELAVAVVRALRRVPERSSVDALWKAYSAFLATPGAKGYEDVREAVAQTLGEYFLPLAKTDVAAGQQVAKHLLDISQKEPQGFSKAVRAAVWALGLMESRKYDRRDAVKDLIAAMAGDPDTTVKKQAQASLVRITGTDQGQEVKKWQGWYEKNKDRLGPE